MKIIKQKINDFFITNHSWRKIKNIFNIFLKAILLRVFLFIVVISFILVIAVNIYKPKLADQIENKFTGYFYSYLKLNNLNYSKITISGNKRIKNEEIIAIIENFDNSKFFESKSDNEFISNIKNLIDEMKIKLPWLDKIIIKRTMPDILNIEIEEYQPFAIWLSEDKKFIIDKDGNQIPFLDEYEESQEFKNMIILSGKGANQNAKSLFNILAINSQISQEIYSANWVGNRRWDIRFYDGLIVKLPEIEISRAWQDLIKFYEVFKSDKAIKSIDLRISGKIYIQYFNKKSNEIKSLKS